MLVLSRILVGLLALIGVAAIALTLMLASPVRPPPPLASIHAGAVQIDKAGAPELSRFQARAGTWLAARLYPARTGARDQIAILAHGSSASSIEMNAVAKALAEAGVIAVALDIRGHGASGTRGDIAYPGELDDDLADLIAELRKDYPNARAYGLSRTCRASSRPSCWTSSESIGRNRCRRSPSPTRRKRKCLSPASTRSA